jgi:hypothetical protein
MIYVVNDPSESVMPDFSDPISTEGRSLSEIFDMIKNAAGVDDAAGCHDVESIHLCLVMPD